MMPDMGFRTLSARAAESGAGAACDLVLGVDPGLLCTGYAVLARTADGREAQLVEAGAIKLDSERALAERLVELRQCLAELIRTHRPAVLACEELYSHYKHPRTAILMAHARGVVLAEAAGHGLEIVSVPATQAKKLLTGSGRASKQQIQRATAATLGLARLPEPHDVADALAIALAALRMHCAARHTLSAVEGTGT